MLTHAGSVVIRSVGGRLEYLLVASSDGENWVLPKGHIEPGELPEETAVRELKEEAGVVGDILGRLAVQRFSKPEEEVTVQYFLVRGHQKEEPAENRTIRWEGEERALELLTFEDARKALRDAAAILSLQREAGRENS